jgi:hypothetical protein
MNPWRWVRARKWWLQLLIALIVVPVALLLLYVAGRSLQYATAERDAGAYVPSTANVVLRARDLESHIHRIQESTAWRVLERKILKDPVLRREINGLLQSNGAPTLDDLDDERKPFARNLPRGIHAVGSDLVAALQVRASLAQAPFCAIVRLRWLHYLAAPFGRLVLPTESVGGETCLVIRQERMEIRVAFAGGLAIVSNDKALLEQALRRKGREEDGGRPLEARVVFEGSPGLLQIRKSIQDSGAFPYVKWDTARGLTASGDLRDSSLLFDATFDQAEPLHSSAPPLAIRSWAPTATSGWLVSNTGAGDLIAWLRGLIGTPGAKDFVGQTAQQALQALDEGGLSSTFLPQLQDGMTVVTGVEEREGRAYTTFTLILPSKDPKAAVEAMNGLVRKIAGPMSESALFETIQVGDVTGYSWRWPNSLQINDLLRPTYAAVKDMFVLGNNRAFTEAVIRAAEQGDGFEQTSIFRKLKSGLKEQGFPVEPSLAGGFLYPPLVRESLDGILHQAAKQMVYAVLNGPMLRAEVEAELRRQGRPVTDAEVTPAFNEAVERKIQEQEAELRRVLRPMDAVKWVAFEASTVPQGIKFRLALEFR